MADLDFSLSSARPIRVLVIATGASTTIRLPGEDKTRIRCIGRRSSEAGAEAGDYLIIAASGSMQADLAAGTKAILDSSQREHLDLIPVFFKADTGYFEVELQAVGGDVMVSIESTPRRWV